MRRPVAAVVIAGVVSLGGLIASERPRAQGPAPADLVLTNGIVLTVDAGDSVAQAVAIADGKIVAVGTAEQVKSRIGAATRVIDLHGRTATPGLIDTHVHFSEADVLYEITLSDVSVKRMDDILAKVRQQVSTLKPGEW